MRAAALGTLAIGLLVACGDAARAPITGREWRVVAIDSLQAPVGAGGRPITLRFDDSTQRVYGFAGCNQYNAAFTLKGDSLSFGPAVSTRMACEGSDGVEQAFLTQLQQTTNGTIDGQLLILSGNGKAIRAHAPAD